MASIETLWYPPSSSVHGTCLTKILYTTVWYTPYTVTWFWDVLYCKCLTYQQTIKCSTCILSITKWSITCHFCFNRCSKCILVSLRNPYYYTTVLYCTACHCHAIPILYQHSHPIHWYTHRQCKIIYSATHNKEYTCNSNMYWMIRHSKIRISILYRFQALTWQIWELNSFPHDNKRFPFLCYSTQSSSALVGGIYISSPDV